MRYFVAIVIILIGISCKDVDNKKQAQPVIEATENNVDTSFAESDSKIESNTKISEDKRQNSLDYSFSLENVKTQEDRASYLKHYFNQYSKSKDSLSEILFFRAFPDSFKDFKATYGYEEIGMNTTYGILYDNYEHIMDYKPINIENKEYIEKLVDISVGGSWQSDNVAHLQNKVIEMYEGNSGLFVQYLKVKDESAIKGFWEYFFDGPHPENQQELYENVVESLKSMNPEMGNIVNQAFADIKEKWSNH